MLPFTILSALHPTGHPRLARGLLVMAIIIFSVAGCESKVLLRPTQTYDISFDGAEFDVPYDLSDSLGDLPDDAGDMAEGSIDSDICMITCANLYYCGMFMHPEECMSICARMDSSIRSCVVSASSCDVLNSCLPDIVDHEICSELCDYDRSCEMMPYTGCTTFCTWFSDIVLDCAIDFMSDDNCPGVEYCLRSFNWGHDCPYVCNVTADCDLVTHEACMADCSTLEEWEMSKRICLDTAAEFGDCYALAACGGIGL